MKQNQRIFVYGTLKKGHYFHEEYLGGEKSKFIGPALTSDDFTLYIDGLPHLVKERGENQVKGEVYEVTEEVLKSLDRLEGHPVVYYRELIDIFIDGKKYLAWAYLRPKFFKGKQYAYKDIEFT